MDLMKKKILFDQCKVLYHEDFTREILAKDFDIRGGEWYVQDGYLIGQNKGNDAGMVISKASYTGNVLLDFKASTILPSTHDISVMWNGAWDYEKNTRSAGYIAGIQGWWQGKAGFEKAPDHALCAATGLFPFEPGREYHFQIGSIDGHMFIYADGQLLFELMDPAPIDNTLYGKIGFEAYCSHIRFRVFYVKQAVYAPLAETYEPEF